MEKTKSNALVYLAWDKYLQIPVALKKDFDAKKATVIRIQNVASGYATHVDLQTSMTTYHFDKDLDELENRFSNLIEL